MCPYSYIASKANSDVLYFHHIIKADDVDDFRLVIEKEIKDFEYVNIFKLIPLKNKPQHKSLIPFV